MRASSKCILNTDKRGTSTTSLVHPVPIWPPLAKRCAIPTLPSVPRSRARHHPLHPLLRALQRAVRSLLNLLFSRWSNLSACSLSSQDMPSSPSTSSVALLWTNLSILTPFFFFFILWSPEHNIQGEYAPTSNTVGELPFLTDCTVFNES